MEDIREMLKKVAAGELSVDNAVLELKKEPFTAAGYDDLGFAKLDTHRKLRQGAAEVIYGAGKTPQQIAGIVEAMKLMNEIESDYDGVVTAILVQNGDTVEYGMPLFCIA